jgi:hypothetical protein
MDYILKSIDISTITLGRALAILGCSLGLAISIMLVYMFTHRRTGWRPSMMMTVMVLGPIVAIIVIAVGSNLARAISIGGGLALIRFRNRVDDPRDLLYLFLSLASGMACGVGFIGFGLISVGLILAVIFLFSLCRVDRIGGHGKRLRILIPESLDYQGVFDPVLKKYCRSYHLNRIKTADYGTVLELDYRVVMSAGVNEKEMIDEIRIRNGNLNITLVENFAEEA